MTVELNNNRENYTNLINVFFFSDKYEMSYNIFWVSAAAMPMTRVFLMKYP